MLGEFIFTSRCCWWWWIGFVSNNELSGKLMALFLGFVPTQTEHCLLVLVSREGIIAVFVWLIVNFYFWHTWVIKTISECLWNVINVRELTLMLILKKPENECVRWLPQLFLKGLVPYGHIYSADSPAVCLLKISVQFCHENYGRYMLFVRVTWAWLKR